MKKIIIILLICLSIVGCSSQKQEEYGPDITYKINARNADMSAYEGLSATGHCFKAVTVQELFNCIDNESSAVFYLGRNNCACCQNVLKYLNEVGLENNVTIYYIDVYDEIMPLTDEELCDKLREYLYDILDEIDGKKELQTPTIFNVVNGKIEDHLICLANWKFDNPPTDKQVSKLKNKYLEIIKPFIGVSQD